MKWGVRRFQNEDGSLTSAGKKRYGTIATVKGDFKRSMSDFRALGQRHIDRKQAKADYKEARSAATTRAERKQAKQDYKDAKREAETARLERMARSRRNESERIEKNYKNTYNARYNDDYVRGQAMALESTAALRRAKDAYKRDRTPENRRAYHKAVANRIVTMNYEVIPSTMGAYERYKENGASTAQAILKAGTFGSMFKHSQLI